MTTRAELSPLFTNIALSADDASAIAAALYDIARCDGEHAEEIEMIKSLLEGIGADLGSDAPAAPGKMTPAELAIAITDPVTRKLAIECARCSPGPTAHFPTRSGRASRSTRPRSASRRKTTRRSRARSPVG